MIILFARGKAFVSFQSLCLFVCLFVFSCLNALDRTCSIMLNRRDSEYLCLVLNWGIIHNISQVCSWFFFFPQIYFIRLRKFPSTPSLLRVFLNIEWILNFIKCFFCICCMFVWFYSFINVMNYINWYTY